MNSHKTHVCLCMMKELLSIEQTNSAPSLKDQLLRLKSFAFNLDEIWLDMAAREYAADRIFIKYKPTVWTRRSMIDAISENKDVFKDPKHLDEFWQYTREFKEMSKKKT